MSEPDKVQQHLFSCKRFRFSLKVTTLTVLPPYKGSVFRGAFGNAFRRMVCAAPKEDCPTCLLRSQCLYVALFEPPPPPGCPDADKFSHAPPPYVLNPPLTNRQAFHPEETLDFELVLMGRAIEALPYFIYTFMEVGKKGLGREKGKYALIGVDLVRNGTPTQIFDAHTQTLTAYPAKTDTFAHPEDDRANALCLHVLTPLRLKEKGDLVTRLTFPLFFERLAQRLTMLAAFYGSNGHQPDLSPLVAKGKEIQVTSDTLYWYDWERYSGRQKSAMKLGGLRGRIRFAGELGPFMPYVRLGEQVNVGQGTSFGLGR